MFIGTETIRLTAREEAGEEADSAPSPIVMGWGVPDWST
jgi:hypothetical protein